MISKKEGINIPTKAIQPIFQTKSPPKPMRPRGADKQVNTKKRLFSKIS